MQIHNVMTKNPVCCLPSEAAVKAAKIMKTEDTGIVPVVETDGERRLVGVVTDRDLCMDVIAEERDPRTVRVDECMTTKLVCCGPSDELDKVMALMKENQVRRIPVVDDQNRIQGIVSMADLIRRGEARPERERETLKQICEPTFEPSKPRAASRPGA